MDRGKLNPTQHLPWWLRETTKRTPIILVRTGIWARNSLNTSSVWLISIGDVLCRFEIFITDVLHSRRELVLQPFRHFTYVTVHSRTFPSLYLRHSLFSNPSVASPTSQLILQPFFRFSYVTGFHLRHLTNRPWKLCQLNCCNSKTSHDYFSNFIFVAISRAQNVSAN